MAVLSARFAVLPLEEMVRILREGGKLPAGAVSVTLDDGYADNYEFAFPVLRRHRLPATIFLTTGYLEGRNGIFWWDEVSRWRAAGKTVVEIEGLGRCSVATWVDQDRLLEELKVLPGDEIVRRVRETSARMGLEPGEGGRDFLSWDQVREMQSEGIRFGPHTVTHCILPRESPERRRAEVEGSRAAVERETGRAYPVFCYPNGDADDAVGSEIREAGFLGAVTTQVADVLPGTGFDVFRIPRKSINHRVGSTVFRFKLSPYPERIKRLAGERRWGAA